ncbi:MAG: T9SS type A sorting domain-containing protein [Bacteroidia bacterium]|nr:T9SS type A sorting domain-containing protein [Bacteroidia bacterium]
MKKLLLLGAMLLTVSLLSAQTLSRQVISSTGSANNQLSYTVGESVVKTAIAGSFILTQGFQQPDETAVNVKKPIEVLVNYKLFPNPSHDKVFLELNSAQALDLKFDMIDMAGKQVRNAEQIKFNGKVKKEIDLTHVASGNYLLRIMTASGEAVKSLKFTRTD